MLLGRPYWGNHHCGCWCCHVGLCLLTVFGGWAAILLELTEVSMRWASVDAAV